MHEIGIDISGQQSKDVVSKNDPHEEQDLAQCKRTRSSIIHAEGV